MVSSDFLASCLCPPLLSEISCVTRFFQKASQCWCCTLANLLKTLYIERKPDLCMGTIETTSQDSELSLETNYTKSWKLLIFNPGSPLENKSCNKYSTVNVTKELYLWNYPMNFYQTKSNRKYKYFSFKQYKYHFYCVNTSYLMDNCFTGRRDRSRQTSEKDVLYIIPAGPARRVHSPGGASYFLFLSRHRDVIASFSFGMWRVKTCFHDKRTFCSTTNTSLLFQLLRSSAVLGLGLCLP